MGRYIAGLVIICCLLSGCARLMLEEQKRALLESYENRKISKVEYLTEKAILQNKEDDLNRKK